MFGQQQNKPMFGTSGLTTSAAPSFGGFGQTSQAGGGGLFGANKPTGKPSLSCHTSCYTSCYHRFWSSCG